MIRSERAPPGEAEAERGKSSRGATTSKCMLQRALFSSTSRAHVRIAHTPHKWPQSDKYLADKHAKQFNEHQLTTSTASNAAFALATASTIPQTKNHLVSFLDAAPAPPQLASSRYAPQSHNDRVHFDYFDPHHSARLVPYRLADRTEGAQLLEILALWLPVLSKKRQLILLQHSIVSLIHIRNYTALRRLLAWLVNPNSPLKIDARQWGRILYLFHHKKQHGDLLSNSAMMASLDTMIPHVAPVLTSQLLNFALRNHLWISEQSVKLLEEAAEQKGIKLTGMMKRQLEKAKDGVGSRDAAETFSDAQEVPLELTESQTRALESKLEKMVAAWRKRPHAMARLNTRIFDAIRQLLQSSYLDPDMLLHILTGLAPTSTHAHYYQAFSVLKQRSSNHAIAVWNLASQKTFPPAFISSIARMIGERRSPEAGVAFAEKSTVLNDGRMCQFGVQPNLIPHFVALPRQPIPLNAGIFNTVLELVGRYDPPKVHQLYHEAESRFGLVTDERTLNVYLKVALETSLAVQKYRQYHDSLRYPPTSDEWDGRPAWKTATSLFWNMLYGTYPEHVDKVYDFSRTQLSRALSPRFHPENTYISYDHIYPSAYTFHLVVSTLGLFGEHHLIPLALCWMKELGIRPEKGTLKMAWNIMEKTQVGVEDLGRFAQWVISWQGEFL